MSEEEKSLNFIEQFVEEDIANAKYSKPIHTRFPPEPNGFLHIGHVKAICLNFEIAKKYGGKTNLRFDDTNPSTEKTDYVDAIKKDIKWLGYDWEDREYYASDYFNELFDFGVKLIKDGNAYVDDSTSEEMAAFKGTPTEPGKNNAYRDRSIEENLDLFTRMKDGEFEDGARVLRAKIDMASPNMLMRDPIIYRIKKETHHRTGDQWCIYPMYDFAHGQSDSIEEITHSLCSLEFRHHRDVYNWLIEKLGIFPSRQIEFARMNVAYMITSKRKLLKLIESKVVNGWDDPRMSTISGLRRRGYPAAALRNFVDRVGMAKRDNLIDMNLLEFCVREELNKTTKRVMVVLDPLRLIVRNYPKGKTEEMIAVNSPEDESLGTRIVPFSKELYIERGDFMENPTKKYFRLAPGRNVRLKNGYIIQCDDFQKNTKGEVEVVYATYYANSKSGSDESGIKTKGVLHWVSAEHALPIEVRNYDRLFNDPTPDGHEGKEFTDFINEDSLEVNTKALAEPSLKDAKEGEQFQFMRNGYFCVDQDSTDDKKVFNRTVTMRDTWAKLQENK